MNDSNVSRPPVALYEVRTCHSEAYWAEGDVIEQADGWFTLWGDAFTLALRVPEADIRAIRQVDPAELHDDHGSDDAVYAQLPTAVRNTLGIDLATGTPDIASALLTACRELEKSEAAREKLRGDRERLRAALAEVLSEFVHETHPGRRCLQTGHINVETVQRWRAIANSDQP